MGGTGNDLTIIKYAGPIEIQNKTGPDLCNVNLNGGEVTIDNTVTGGTVTLSGVGKWANSDTYIGGATVLNNLVDPADIPAPIDYALVWDELLGSGQSAEQELITASTNATGAQAEAIAAKNQAATNTALLQALPAPDNATILEIAKAHFNKRKWDKIGDTITIYESDGVTPFKVFDTNGDLSEITPQ